MKTIKVIDDIEITEEMIVGGACKHPDGRLVKIIGGSYLSGGRVSNFWYWREILADCTLGEEEHGYGWYLGCHYES